MLCGLAFGLLGCGSREELPERLTSPPRIGPERRTPAQDPLYGPDGELLESAEMVAGLPLPRGAEPWITEERRHVYRSEVPLTKLRRYFGTRLLTGEVDVRGDRVTYRNAVSSAARGAEVRMNVTIEPISGDITRIEVAEIPPTPVRPPPEQETLERLARELSQGD